MGDKTPPTRYYVYDLIDPRDGAVFYVGKGQGKRRYQHLQEALNGKRSRKCDRIRAILDGGHEYQTRIASHHNEEIEALEAEAARIASFGLDSLTNVYPNGWVFVGPSKAKQDEAVAQAFVRRDRVRLLSVRALLSVGQRFKMGPLDVTDLVALALNSLRDMAGAEYFDNAVGVFERTSECLDAPLFSITAERCEHGL